MARVPLIDDDETILEAVSAALDAGGHTSSCVVDAGTALATAKQFHPNLIIIDYLLSGTDGKKVIALLRSTQETKHLPIVMASAHPAVKEQAKEAGADGFLPKPFDIEELWTLVESFTQ